MLLPEKQIGRVAVDELLAKIADPLTARPARVVPLELMPGATCVAPGPS
jgi:DNA-binding LacI/PurR family transcriptional regulator